MFSSLGIARVHLLRAQPVFVVSAKGLLLSSHDQNFVACPDITFVVIVTFSGQFVQYYFVGLYWEAPEHFDM